LTGQEHFRSPDPRRIPRQPKKRKRDSTKKPGSLSEGNPVAAGGKSKLVSTHCVEVRLERNLSVKSQRVFREGKRSVSLLTHHRNEK